MRRITFFVATTFLCLSLVGPGILCAKDKKEAEAEALLARARELSDIRCEGCPPFRLKARVRLLEVASQPVEGTYTLSWASLDKWRDGLDLPDYSEVRLGLGEKILTRRSTRYRPHRIVKLVGLFDFADRLRVLAKSKVKKIREESLPDGACICADYREAASGRLQGVCFLSSDGVLIREHTPPDSYLYQDFVPLAHKYSFPRTLRRFVSDQLAEEVHVEELIASPTWEPGLFDPITGPDVRESCRHPEPARAVHTEVPSLPNTLLGVFLVVIDLTVQVDGRARDPIVVRTSDPRVTPIVLKAISGWRFVPAKCNGVPFEVQVTTELEIHHDH